MLQNSAEWIFSSFQEQVYCRKVALIFDFEEGVGGSKIKAFFRQGILSGYHVVRFIFYLVFQVVANAVLPYGRNDFF